MDFIKFLNSKDIAEHLRKIKYEFSPEEALYVIHGSRNSTLAEKREAYSSLLAKYHDYNLRERGFGAFKDHTLESFLRTYFRKQDALIAECKRDGDDAVYSVCTYNSPEGWNCDDDSLFHTFGECFSAMKEDEAEKAEIAKQYLPSGRTVTLSLLPDGRILDVGTSERDDEVMDAFEMLYVEIPTPFRFGDIVIPVREKVWDSTFHTPYEEVCVLTHLASWDREAMGGCDPRETRSMEAYEKLREKHLQTGDETDMAYSGYFVTDSGILCDHNIWGTYLDLEYFRGELSGRGRSLKAISLYFQRKINLETLLAALKAVEAEETKREIWETCLQGYEEEMKQIGIKGEEH